MATATPSLVTGVDFVSLPTRDLEKAVEFYGTTLALPRSMYRPDRNFAEFETGNLTLSVIDAERMGMKHGVSQNPIMAFFSDPDELTAEETAGVRPRRAGNA
jgi:catechol 2,3-dioxygenase-like lactoylglutathione lyase family enzyme